MTVSLIGKGPLSCKPPPPHPFLLPLGMQHSLGAQIQSAFRLLLNNFRMVMSLVSKMFNVEK